MRTLATRTVMTEEDRRPTAEDIIRANRELNARVNAEDTEWSTGAKVAGALLFLGAGAYLATRVYTGAIPSPQELYFLISPDNKFSLAHVKIMRRLAEACSYSVDKMMAAIYKPAMSIAETQVAAFAMFQETGSRLYDIARMETIQKYCAENVLPILRATFTDFVRYAQQGVSDIDIFNIMSSPTYGMESTQTAARTAMRIG